MQIAEKFNYDKQEQGPFLLLLSIVLSVENYRLIMYFVDFT